jgi:hypothetical protein
MFTSLLSPTLHLTRRVLAGDRTMLEIEGIASVMLMGVERFWTLTRRDEQASRTFMVNAGPEAGKAWPLEWQACLERGQ